MKCHWAFNCSKLGNRCFGCNIKWKPTSEYQTQLKSFLKMEPDSVTPLLGTQFEEI